MTPDERPALERPTAVSGVVRGATRQHAVSRRTVGRGAISLLALGVGSAAVATFGSEPALAIEGEDAWIVDGAEIVTHDGSVDDLTFGDPVGTATPGEDDERLVLEWEGFNDDGQRTAVFDVLARGTGDGWDGPQETFESIIVDDADDPATVELTGTNGSETYAWADVFGLDRPADVAEHTAFSADYEEFEASEDGETVTRELEVRVEVDVPDEELSAAAVATAEITVSNLRADVSVGGRGSFLLESDQET